MDTLDKTDMKILETLSSDGRISVRELAETINLSHTPTLKRLNNLRSAGYIQGFRAILNENMLGGSMTVFTWVSLVSQSRRHLEEFEKVMAESPEVSDCFLMTGDADYLIRVSVDNLQQFESFLADRLSALGSVTGIKSSFALRPIVQNQVPPSVQRRAQTRESATRPGI